MMNTRRHAMLLGFTLTAAGAFAQTVPLTQDSFMNSGVGTNFGIATTLNVGGAANSQALAQFDLGSLQDTRSPESVLGMRLNVAVGLYCDSGLPGPIGPSVP